MATAKRTPTYTERAGKILVKELAEFIEIMQKPAQLWPGFSDQEMAEYVARAIMEYGRRKNLPISLPQTISHEIQDIVCQSQADFYIQKSSNLISNNSKPVKRIIHHGTMNYYYPDKPADLGMACIVSLNGQDLEIKYDQEDGEFWRWSGVEQGEGHWILNANHGARATLHRISDSKFLEGYWAEGGLKGMWRIELGRTIKGAIT